MTNHNTTETINASRPKIYRLPDEPKANTKLYVTRTLVILCITAIVVIVLPNMIHGKKPATISEFTPEIAKVTASDELAKSIRVGDESSQIVGQITKLPNDEEKQISIGSSNKVDNGSGKELLRIISQY